MKRAYSGTKKIVVMPTCRRGGSDASRPSHNQDYIKLFNQLNKFEELNHISSRLSEYASTTSTELTKLKTASETRESESVQKSAENIARLAEEIGATGMLRICYQVLIAARQGQFDKVDQLHFALHDEFIRYKSTLRIAT